jgi:2,4-dienoyl-CoA reductase-like NADH-dependent reductase (Old Yellow Enzyme family)
VTSTESEARSFARSLSVVASRMDQATSLLSVGRYQRRPNPANSIVALMLKAIPSELPLEAAIVRREVDLGRALRDEEIEEEIKAFQAASRNAA